MATAISKPRPAKQPGRGAPDVVPSASMEFLVGAARGGSSSTEAVS